MGVGHYHTDVSLLKFCKAKNNTGEKKKKRPRGAGGKCRAPFFRCCRPVRSLDLKMRAPSHPYERGTESNGRVTRRKAIKKEREKTKKRETRLGPRDMDDRGDTRLFHKVDQESASDRKSFLPIFRLSI